MKASVESTILAQPLQWAEIPHIDDIDRLSEQDRECFRDLRDVLAKHNALNRFGINLIHKHFEVKDDECLVEIIDAETRTLTVRPAKKSMIGDAVETQWRLAEGDAYIVCNANCVPRAGGHGPRHFTPD
jgi:hypothetical protein